MNNEIKEILDKLQYGFCSELTYEKLLYYITNLQQELEKKNAYIKYLEEYNPKYYKGEKFYGVDYKSRCEKAVEIAKDLKQFVYDELVDRNVSGATETHSKIIDLLDILKW